jgi:transposase-like protein
MVAPVENPRTLMEAMRHFDPDRAESFVASIKWPEGPHCPKCGSVNVGHIKSRRRYQCREKGCRRQFGLMVNTIMEDSHLPLDKWLIAVWMIANCRNGISSYEIARTIGCKQQSSWHLLHRVRHVLAAEHTDKLQGGVEADSTLVGGLVVNMPRRRRKMVTSRHPHANKTIVHALRERRTGNVRAVVVQDETTETVSALLDANVDRNACLFTDSAHVYNAARRALGFAHKTVNHGRKEYVRGEVHVNGCENFFNCLRRAVKGTYIRPSPEHLAAYVGEAVYRFNVRKESEWVRFNKAMQLIVGKRLTYSALTGGAIR